MSKWSVHDDVYWTPEQKANSERHQNDKNEQLQAQLAKIQGVTGEKLREMVFDLINEDAGNSSVAVIADAIIAIVSPVVKLQATAAERERIINWMLEEVTFKNSNNEGMMPRFMALGADSLENIRDTGILKIF
jgi:hypothetical protein